MALPDPTDVAACQAQLRKSDVGQRPAPLRARIERHDPDPTWPLLYEREVARLRAALGDRVVRRLRRWHRELRLRDVLGAPSAADAERRLKDCETKLEDYTQRVFDAVGGR